MASTVGAASRSWLPENIGLMPKITVTPVTIYLPALSGLSTAVCNVLDSYWIVDAWLLLRKACISVDTLSCMWFNLTANRCRVGRKPHLARKLIEDCSLRISEKNSSRKPGEQALSCVAYRP